MKKQYFVIGGAILFFSFFAIKNYYSLKERDLKYQESEIENIKTKKSISSESNSFGSGIGTMSQEQLQSQKQEAKELFESLMTFKDKSDFHVYGFGGKYKYNKWLKKVEQLKSMPNPDFLLKYGFSIGDIEMLGLEYMKSEGKETEFSLWAKERINKGLNMKD